MENDGDARRGPGAATKSRLYRHLISLQVLGVIVLNGVRVVRECGGEERCRMKERGGGREIAGAEKKEGKGNSMS